MEVQVKDRQSLLDMAVQTSGSMEAAFDLSVANDVSLTEVLAEGHVLNTVAAVNAATVRRYSVQGIRPATALSDEEMAALGEEGVNFMGIEIDFVVN